MQNYTLDIEDNILYIRLFDKESNMLFEEIRVTPDDLLKEFDKTISRLDCIEKFNLVENILKLKIITFNDDDTYLEEEVIFNLSDRVLNNKKFMFDLYQRLNKYNGVVKNETLDNIAAKKCNPNVVKKRRLQQIS